ncbi:MAG TPA: glucose 1-dehydrogenase [Casimicrobiaceae bacterium]|nr:glucose 1-dehydrogenase [Casimicrobiaceae bacterium]
MDLGLEGRIALVTGAGSGIGAAIASALAREGCVTYFGDVDPQAATRAAAQGPRPGRALELDVGDAASLRASAQRIVDEHGRIDVLVNNAGILKSGSVVDATIEDWDQVCRVNLSGVYYCCKAVMPSMLRRRSGSIVNIASVSAARGGGVFGNVLYGTTKAGVVALTKGLARELGPSGIRVNCIAPAVTETGMTRALLTPERRLSALASIPLGRFATAEDIANMVLILASDVSSFVTGETIVVDGGYLTR